MVAWCYEWLVENMLADAAHELAIDQQLVVVIGACGDSDIGKETL